MPSIEHCGTETSSSSAQKAFNLCVAKARRNIRRLADEPRSAAFAENGNYFAFPEGFFDIGNWTSSFHTGMALLAWQSTKDAYFLEQIGRLAEAYRAKVNEHAMDTMHDLGFLFSLYSVALYKLTGHPAHLDLGLRAAQVLADRFVSQGGYIRAWGRTDESNTDYAGLAIIDCLMNLPLLFWASRETGDSHFAEIATRHAHTALHTMMRDDYSVCHAFRFDLKTGAATTEANYCGRAVGSHWARGTTWAFYGFAMAYRYTHDERFREAARNIAHTFIKKLDAELVPVWDFRLPAGEHPFRDASAAAIAVCGFQELQRIGIVDPEFADVSQRMLARLCTEDYLDHDANTPGVLRNAQVGNGVGVARNAFTSWGDYFLMEALSQSLHRGPTFW